MTDEVDVEKIGIKDLTTGAINGDGVFDEIMSTIQIRLDREWDKDRIKGTDYSKVYLGAMEASMQQSIAFLLGKDKAYIESLLIDAQREKTEAEILKVEAETKLINQKNSNSIIEGQILSIQLEIAKLTEIKTEQEIENLKAVEAAEWAKTLDIVDGVPVTGLIGAQKFKVNADTDLTVQRKKTEMSNILDTIDGNPIAGINGKKMSLYQQQGDGFTRDAEQKLTKIMTDTWSVRASTNENTDTRFTNLDNESIGEVVNKAKAGIGT